LAAMNLHIYPSAFKNESRMLKETRSLLALGLVSEIRIAALWEEGLKRVERLDPDRTVHRLALCLHFGSKNLLTEGLRYFEFMIRILMRFGRRSTECVNCHSLHVLPIGALFKILFGSFLIYDTHELETENFGMRGLRKPVAKFLERALMPLVDEVVVVSDSIGDWYQATYRLPRVFVVKNVPCRGGKEPRRNGRLREKFEIPAGEPAFIYVGRLNERTGANRLMEVWPDIDPSRHLVFMGMGELEEPIRELSRIHPHIHFKEAVAPHEVLEVTAGADAGINFVENTCLNAYFCLSNKVFEYILAGVPIIVRDFPDLGNLVHTYGCGWTVSDRDRDLVELVNGLDMEEIRHKKENTLKARRHLGWHLEEKAYHEIYQGVLLRREEKTTHAMQAPGLPAHAAGPIPSSQESK